MQMECWLVGFRDWWLESGEEWPVRPNRDFHAQAWWYANNRKTGQFETTSGLATTLFQWIFTYFHLFPPIFDVLPAVRHVPPESTLTSFSQNFPHVVHLRL